jgi:hypothetical protein
MHGVEFITPTVIFLGQFFSKATLWQSRWNGILRESVGQHMLNVVQSQKTTLIPELGASHA